MWANQRDPVKCHTGASLRLLASRPASNDAWRGVGRTRSAFSCEGCPSRSGPGQRSQANVRTFGFRSNWRVMVKRGYLSALLLLLVAVHGFAASYVVPTDRFEIERSHVIVVGHVLSSHVEKSPDFGIETITDFVVEDAIKGDPGLLVQIHEP